VILKVRRPGVGELVARDLEMIRRLEFRAAWARAYHVADLGSGFADALAEELDFAVEARIIAAIATAATRVKSRDYASFTLHKHYLSL
jgi:ubiquinone biosynthesis protein